MVANDSTCPPAVMQFLMDDGVDKFTFCSEGFRANKGVRHHILTASQDMMPGPIPILDPYSYSRA